MKKESTPTLVDILLLILAFFAILIVADYHSNIGGTEASDDSIVKQKASKKIQWTAAQYDSIAREYN
jgi:hypothetical protein